MVHSIGTFPGDTYNVILSNQDRALLKKASSNTKRAVIIDNRDKMVSYDKDTGYLFNTADLSRNKFAMVLFTLWDDSKDKEYFKNVPEGVLPVIDEIESILHEWNTFAEKFKHIELYEASETLEQNEAFFEVFLESLFLPEIARKKAKKEQRKARKELRKKFLEIRPDFKNNQAAYMSMAEDALATDIKQFDEMKSGLSFPKGLAIQKKLNDRIKQRAAAIKRAIYRAEKDKEEKEF